MVLSVSIGNPLRRATLCMSSIITLNDVHDFMK